MTLSSLKILCCRLQACVVSSFFLLSLVALPALAHAPVDSISATAKKKIVFLAGSKSHKYGEHEYYAGSVLLAKSIQESYPNFQVEVIENGWPREPTVFEDADTIVVYSDGGPKHPLLDHLKEFDSLMQRGVGFVCIHFSTEIPQGVASEHLLNWLGGYFETDWSVNPHWLPEFNEWPTHPITRGVRPLSNNDGWYFHLRFAEDRSRITPILTAIPPKSTMDRPDSPHSGNPHVRQSVERGDRQTLAWTFDREDGGRSFGFTGGHHHWNWGDANYRRFMLNAILWTAKHAVPADGFGSRVVTMAELEMNQDFEPPVDFDREKTIADFQVNDSQQNAATKPLFRSPVVNSLTPKHSVDIKADIRGATDLYLVVTDGGNGFSFDWADWLEPKLVGDEKSQSLCELKWSSAQTSW